MNTKPIALTSLSRAINTNGQRCGALCNLMLLTRASCQLYSASPCRAEPNYYRDYHAYRTRTDCSSEFRRVRDTFCGYVSHNL